MHLRSLSRLALALLGVLGMGGGSCHSSAAQAPAADPGARRPYELRVPRSYDGSRGLPLLVLLHGYTADAAIQERYFAMGQLAEQRGFFLLLPQGTPDRAGARFWNATDACCDVYGAKVDDVGYLRGAIAEVRARYRVDPRRVYLAGASNGGFMAYRLACEISEQIAGVVSLAGATWAEPARCRPRTKVAVLQIHGDADRVIRPEGGRFRDGLARYPGAKETVASWAAYNGCGKDLVPTAERLDLDDTLPGKETRVLRHACAHGAAELWLIAGGPHVPHLAESAAAAIYDFLVRYEKP